MATSVVSVTGRLSSTLSDVTNANTSASAKAITPEATAEDNVNGTIDSTTTPAELDLSTVAKTDEHWICLRNLSTAATSLANYVAHFAVRTVAVASGSVVEGSYYLVITSTCTYNSIAYAPGSLVVGVAGQASYSGGSLILLAPIGLAYPGESFGPIRREAFTAAGYGAIYHWAAAAIKLERCAAECGTPSA